MKCAAAFCNWHGCRLGVSCLLLIISGCVDPSGDPQTQTPPDASASETAKIAEATPLALTIVWLVSLEQRLEMKRTEQRWLTTRPISDVMEQSARSFVSYLLCGVGDKCNRRFGPDPPFAYPARYEAEPNGSHLRSLVPLYRIFKCFRDECGAFEGIESIQLKTGFFGEFVEAKCRGEKGRKLIRLTFNQKDGKVDGAWITESTDDVSTTPTAYARTKAIEILVLSVLRIRGP